MEVVKVGVSPRSMGKLKKGQKVRMCGGDLAIYVKPEKFKHMERVLLKGKGLHMALDADELAHNEGQGVFKKAKKMVVNTAKKVGRQAVKEVAPYVGDTLGTLGALGATVTGNPELAPMSAIAGKALGDKLAEHYKPMALDALRTHKGRQQQPRSRSASVDMVGNPAMARASLGNAMANLASARMTAGERMAGRGLGAGMSPNVGGRNQLITHAIENPALTSKPLSANFQFRHTLPPQYQRIGSGRGLYAGRASGLYAQGLYS
jgi:hypothetical protein